jgi:hypothetical protein
MGPELSSRNQAPSGRVVQNDTCCHLVTTRFLITLLGLPIREEIQPSERKPF